RVRPETLSLLPKSDFESREGKLARSGRSALSDWIERPREIVRWLLRYRPSRRALHRPACPLLRIRHSGQESACRHRERIDFVCSTSNCGRAPAEGAGSADLFPPPSLDMESLQNSRPYHSAPCRAGL